MSITFASQITLLYNSTMQQLSQSKKFEYNLEALRGFVAFLVVLTHCSGFDKLLNGTQRTGIWTYSFPGHLAVLIFFILSGYVIGLSTKNSLTWHTAGEYLKKRLLRLYPIYALALIMALIITYNTYSLTTIIANFTFTHMALADAIYEVGVIWSLHYEMLFYILFIPISIYNIKPSHAFFISLTFGFFSQLILSSQALAMYGFGFCFWLIGLWLSKTKNVLAANPSRYTLIGLFLLILSFSSLNIVYDIIHNKLHLDKIPGVQSSYSAINIMFSDFSYIPLGVLCITYFTNKKIKFNYLLLIFTLAVPILNLLFLAYYSRAHYIDFDSKVIACLIYAAAIGFLILGSLKTKLDSNTLPKYLIKLGSISYSVYLTHFIFIVLLSRVSFYYGTWYTLIGRSVVVIIFTIVASYILEKVWHPFVVRQVKKFNLFTS
ncbi:acyltransferase [Hymenobacter sp. 5516J-16]|uniref:acyltransferase family protein n=1 Tax=Hymenobacter sp. 5516J-16 TaxID=2932253 RepID=UPI001FD10211|nr:acyltransferase [Hymenobacter sp. 5516J-16]UOQ76164.1 acyltransferase [Hymenobacter sp. 5516J-16]